MNYDKDEVLKLSDEIGIKRATEQLGLQCYTIADWRESRKAQCLKAIPPLSEAEMKIRNAELEKEIAELKRANDILKDALGFFAKVRLI